MAVVTTGGQCPVIKLSRRSLGSSTCLPFNQHEYLRSVKPEILEVELTRLAGASEARKENVLIPHHVHRPYSLVTGRGLIVEWGEESSTTAGAKIYTALSTQSMPISLPPSTTLPSSWLRVQAPAEGREATT
jgi:hypothetical protein